MFATQFYFILCATRNGIMPLLNREKAQGPNPFSGLSRVDADRRESPRHNHDISSQFYPLPREHERKAIQKRQIVWFPLCV